MKNKRVVVGLSGGVDSSVAAYLLKEQGYDVIGMFMKNWHDDTVTISDECPWLEDSNDAMIVADKLGIPFQAIDLSKEYKERIVNYMFSEYQKGRTPNPDVLCNREIKFDIFLKTAMMLKADYVATGHYCRKDSFNQEGSEVFQLKAGMDNNKDQSYFLCQLNQQQLSKALFPIGALTKPEVRAIAKEQGLITAEKKDSQGLCFIGKVRLPDFLQQQLKPKKGRVLEIDAKHPVYNSNSAATLEEMSASFQYNATEHKDVGEHNGAHFFTVGQRKGLGIGGTPEPLFILQTDTEKNLIYTGQGENHPGLYREALAIENEEVHWVRNDLRLNTGEKASYQVRIRYRQPLENATVIQEKDHLYIQFERPQKAIAKGQFAAWYKNDELIGSGVISD